MTNASRTGQNSVEPQMARSRDWRRIGLWLVGATMSYNVAEGVVALWAGMQAGSIALVGFGLDSFIECAAAAALFWRLGVEARGADPETVERSEQRVQRFVGGTFLVLTLYVLLQAGWTLWNRHTVEESVIGIVLAGVSLVVMPLVSWGKLHAAQAIGSDALRSEAMETLACSYLSLTLLLGLVANAVAGWWWADPIAALLMVPWLVKEGMEGIRGETAREDATRRDRTALCRPSNGPAPLETGTTEICYAAVRQHCGLALGDYVYQKTVMSDLSTLGRNGPRRL